MKDIIKRIDKFYKEASISSLSRREFIKLLEDSNANIQDLISMIDDNTSSWALEEIYKQNADDSLEVIILRKAIETNNVRVLYGIATRGKDKYLKIMIKELNEGMSE